MKAIPSYTKVLSLGSAYTEDSLTGPVVLQEKLDGSQFSFGLNEDGEIVMRSKGAVLMEDNYADMFKEAVEYVLSISDIIKRYPKDTYFYTEYLQKPKHNTLKYKNIPKNHLMLFDVLSEQKWQERGKMEVAASLFQISVIPELYRGKATVDSVKSFLTAESCLGDEIIEGVVIKNYTQTILLGGHVFPLFTKHVREAFKERHAADWGIRQPKGQLQEFIDGFKSEARWKKSILHAKEKGLLTQSPKDIGPLLKMIQEDIVTEEEENIKRHLFKCFVDDIKRKSVAGFPIWYKDQLLKNVKESK